MPCFQKQPEKQFLTDQKLQAKCRQLVNQLNFDANLCTYVVQYVQEEVIKNGGCTYICVPEDGLPIAIVPVRTYTELLKLLHHVVRTYLYVCSTVRIVGAVPTKMMISLDIIILYRTAGRQRQQSN